MPSINGHSPDTSDQVVGSGLRQVVEHPAEADYFHAVARTTLFDRDPKQISSRLTPAWLILEIW
jgi:hypothetical protein